MDMISSSRSMSPSFKAPPTGALKNANKDGSLSSKKTITISSHAPAVTPPSSFKAPPPPPPPPLPPKDFFKNPHFDLKAAVNTNKQLKSTTQAPSGGKNLQDDIKQALAKRRVSVEGDDEEDNKYDKAAFVKDQMAFEKKESLTPPIAPATVQHPEDPKPRGNAHGVTDTELLAQKAKLKKVVDGGGERRSSSPPDILSSLQRHPMAGAANKLSPPDVPDRTLKPKIDKDGKLTSSTRPALPPQTQKVLDAKARLKADAAEKKPPEDPKPSTRPALPPQTQKVLDAKARLKADATKNKKDPLDEDTLDMRF